MMIIIIDVWNLDTGKFLLLLLFSNYHYHFRNSFNNNNNNKLGLDKVFFSLKIAIFFPLFFSLVFGRSGINKVFCFAMKMDQFSICFENGFEKKLELKHSLIEIQIAFFCRKKIPIALIIPEM